jgi:adenylate cyclase class 2
MIEVEIRTVVQDHSSVEKTLSQNYGLVKQKSQVDEYFSHPSRDFYANPKIREYLRIRTEKNKCNLAYHKAHLKDGKKTHTDEYEVNIEDSTKIKEILLNLGFKPFVTVTKNRQVFDCNEFEASLDHIKELGYFLEIEAKKDFGGIEKTQQECINFLEKIGVQYIPAPDKGYPDMIAEKLIKK